MKSNGQIFIGGTGRSGTTILSEILGLHNNIYRLETESRFIIDPNGIIDLVPALSKNWSPYIGDRKVSDFYEIMKNLGEEETFFNKIIRKTMKEIFGISPKSYLQMPLGKVIGKDYFMILNNFYNELINSRFQGMWVGSKSYKFKSKIINPKRFRRNEIINLSSEFIDELFSKPMKNKSKEYWVDHTPFNILHAEFLLELFPEAKIIHIYRDIRDVISSYKTKSWGGEKAEDIILWQKNILLKWLEIKKSINGNNYYEIKLEDLVNEPKNKLKEITSFIGVEFDENMLSIDLKSSHSGRWKNDLNETEKQLIQENLLEIMNLYGYKW